MLSTINSTTLFLHRLRQTTISLPSVRFFLFSRRFSSPPRKPTFDYTPIEPYPPPAPTKSYPTTYPPALKILTKYHKHPTFRGNQETVISILHHGGSVLYVLPTGGGKSLIYQVLTRTLRLKRENGFVTPDRLETKSVYDALLPNPISLLVIDEAHQIPLSGMNYRSTYLRLPTFTRIHSPARILLTSATLTEPQIEDLARAFYIHPDRIFRAPIFRPNLLLRVEPVADEDKKYERLKAALQEYPGNTIIYVTSRKGTMNLVKRLQESVEKGELPGESRTFAYYHGRQNSLQRNRVQDQFTNPLENDMVIVSTSAFGMGLNVGDVRQVIHYNIPTSTADYVQEIGRAGRDGRESRCLALSSKRDVHFVETLIREFNPSLRSIEDLVQVLAKRSSRGIFETNLWKQAAALGISVSSIYT
ncbi:P-loop containing nucleoside triphosphate hydrolase protein [Kalaharituber pfeilii]|nr:P-loop containing nucleoside triphosphate hydrolase protein [Kalaharituber pfeilii]